MPNVAICTPSVGMVRTRYCSSLMRMLVYYQNHPILGMEEEPRYLSYHVIEGSMVGSARETFVDDILTLDSTHLLFIDEDMGFREDVLNILLSRQVPFVSCNYRMKVAPCPFTARKPDDSGWIETNSGSVGLEETLFNGFGFSLIERKVLEAVSKPRFENKWIKEANGYTTEDKSFCLKAKEAGYSPMIDHKASKRVYHIGTWAFSWDDEIEAKKIVPMAERYRTK